MLHGKFLYQDTVKGMKSPDMLIGVFGIFNTTNVKWDYYVVSFKNEAGGIKLTPEIGECYKDELASFDLVIKYGKKFDTVEEGEKFCKDFILKWESGSNNNQQEKRDKKINEILK